MGFRHYKTLKTWGKSFPQRFTTSQARENRLRRIKKGKHRKRAKIWRGDSKKSEKMARTGVWVRQNIAWKPPICVLQDGVQKGTGFATRSGSTQVPPEGSTTRTASQKGAEKRDGGVGGGGKKKQKFGRGGS